MEKMESYTSFFFSPPRELKVSNAFSKPNSLIYWSTFSLLLSFKYGFNDNNKFVLGSFLFEFMESMICFILRIVLMSSSGEPLSSLLDLSSFELLSLLLEEFFKLLTIFFSSSGTSLFLEFD